MAIKYAITKFPVAFPTKVLAQKYATHMFSVIADDDIFNGAIVAVGDYKDLDRYEEGTAVGSAVVAKIVDQAPNGNWYVQFSKDLNPFTEAAIVYNTPVIEEEYNTAFKKLENYYIPEDTEMRVYPISAGDIWELSTAAFSGTPTKGAAITGVTGKKLTV